MTTRAIAEEEEQTEECNRPFLGTRRKAEARMKRGADSSVAVDRVRT
jgi:hypothetical protein